MEIPPLPQDLDGTTGPLLFRFPASPHLAAERENVCIDPTIITDATDRLRKTFDVVLLEGVGGINVPLRRDYLVADYLQERKCSLIIVTSGRLGSINHTLLTLEAATHRQIPLAGIVFNHYPPSDAAIRDDALEIFRHRIAGALVEMPEIDLDNIPDVDFSPVLRF
jgi:dethiobiotin synthetase